MSSRVALAIAALAACRPAPRAEAPSNATEPASPGAFCDGASARVTLEPLPAIEGLIRFRASPHGEYRETEAVQRWEADLNGDGLLDRAVFYEGSCGNYGECVTGVYAGCGGDEFVVLRGPDYEYELELAATETVVDGVLWRDLTVTGRTERTTLPPQRVVFDGARYR